MRARAWMMNVGTGRRVAAGTHHVVEYLLSPETIGLPLAPAHCPAVLIWREQIIPSVDLARLSPSQAPPTHAWHGAVVLAYQEAPSKPLRYGALLVYAAPEETWVSNDMACPLPEESAAFRYFTCACFAHQEQAIPVVDTARLFSESPPWTPTPHAGESEDALSPMETTPATPAGSGTTRSFVDSPQILEQKVSRDESSPEVTEHQSEPAKETTRAELQKNASPIESASSPDSVAPASDPRPDAPVQIPPATVPSADVDHPAAITEVSPGERRALRTRQAQQIIMETLAAIHDEVGLERVLFGVPTPDRRSVRAHFYRGVDTDSPLREFRFERGGPNLFARLVAKPQHIWVHAGNRDRLTRLVSAEMRESLGESEFFASSIFVRTRLLGVCYGDEFPSTAGLDEYRYQRFKDLCHRMARRLGEISA